MRSELEIKQLVIDFANGDGRIRAVLLNGSRANPHVTPDNLQDYDLLFIVTDLEIFLKDHSWTDVFGEKLISQMPDEMIHVGEKSKVRFSYLMIFDDGNRFDLTLFPVEQLDTSFKHDSLTIVWVDKDKRFTNLPKASDKDYHISKPTETEFLETCNEFWWVSTYVAKGLVRNEIISAKEMLETVVRPMFMKVIGWKVASENNFSVSIGKGGKYLKKYLTPEHFGKMMASYSDHSVENNWKSLFVMTDMFSDFAMELSVKLSMTYNIEEQGNAVKYLSSLYNLKL